MVTAEFAYAHILKRAIDTKKLINAKELIDQGYSPREVADFMYEVMVAQVRKDIIPITIAETVEKFGADIGHVTKLMVEVLKEKYGAEK